jgi:hypothetical protein
MITHRRLSAAAITASCAALAVLGTASGAAASSNVTTTGQIKACYKASGSLPPLDHIASTGPCPAGDSSLTWNQTGPRGPRGPQGPAGISTGVSGYSTDAIRVDQGPSVSIPVLVSAQVQTTGAYYVSASVTLSIDTGDAVGCALDTPNQGVASSVANVGPVTNHTYETLPLAGSVYLAAGQNLEVTCADSTSDSLTSFTQGDMAATLINTAYGGVIKPSRGTHHPLLPHM